MRSALERKMKNKMKIIQLLLIIVLCVLAGCNNNYEEMIDEFNEDFFRKGYLPPAPYTTSSSDFNELEMLDEIISMPDGSISVFSAPDGGEGCTYEWKAHVPCKDSDGKDFINETVIETDRTLSYKAPGIFNSDKENKLTLTVTEASGKKYTDSARVFITIE